jgi:catalase
MVLDRNPDNFFAEIEQAAFCPASIVPGIDFSADKLLQGRVFSYADTQRHRLGTNYLQIPVNRPQVPTSNNQQDGAMQIMPNSGSTNYEPNTLAEGIPKEAIAMPMEKLTITGEVMRKKISRTNDFQQAGERYRSLFKVDQDHLVDNIIDSLCKAGKPIQLRVVSNFEKADAELGKRIKKGLKL